MPAPLRRLRIAVFCLLAFTSLTLMSYSQNVTTWHNDINRTGWQQNETTLCASAQTGCTPVTQTNFGLLWQWGSPLNPLTGRIYAQPLAVANVQTTLTNCTPSCDLIFVATERDVLYAFKATSNVQTPIWSVNLATKVGGTAIDCSQHST